MTEELKPIDVSKYTVTESGNVIRTDNKQTLKNALERITELEKEKLELKRIILELQSTINNHEYYQNGYRQAQVDEQLKYEKKLFHENTKLEISNFRKEELYKELQESKATIKKFTNETQWHKLDWEKDFPKAGQLLRVRTYGGMEYICETDYYEPAEDEIGYGEVIIQFYDLKGEWVDDNEVEYWCELPVFKE